MANLPQATVVTGQRDVQTFQTESRRSRDVTPALAQLEPDAGPLTTFLTKLRKKSSTDPKVEWFEDELLPRFDTLGADLTAAATTMTVNNYKFFRANDMVRINDAEVVRVSVTPTNSTVTIVRAVGEVSATAALNTQRLHIIGNSNQEGSSSRALLSTQRVGQFNYCQIIRDPWALTGTAKVTTTFAGQDWDEEAMKQLIEHKKHIEYSFLIGQRFEDLTGTHPQRTTRGVSRFIATFVTDISGPLTEQLFDNFLRTAYRYGRKTKVLFAAPILMQAINAFAKGKLRVIDKVKSYGISLQAYENAGRTVMLHEHNLMTNLDLSDFTGIGGEGYLLDIEDCMARYMKGRFTTHNMNIQAPDADLRQDDYLSEVGLEVHHERKHAKLQNVTG